MDLIVRELMDSLEEEIGRKTVQYSGRLLQQDVVASAEEALLKPTQPESERELVAAKERTKNALRAWLDILTRPTAEQH